MLVDMDPPVFGYFTAALIATTGIALASGVQFVVIGLWRRRETIHLSYAMLCLCIAGLALGNLLLLGAGNLPGATAALRGMIGVSILSFPPFVAFISAYTGAAAGWRVKLVLVLLALLFLWLDLVTPTTLFYTRLTSTPGIVLPWGEHLYGVAGTISAWGWLFHLASYAAFLWALWRTWRQYRAGERLLASLLGACLLVQFAALLWGDIAIDLFGVRSPYLDAFSFLPFVLLMSLSLAAQLQQRSTQLEETRLQLEAEAHTRREAESNLHHIAYHDSLTGLPNRALVLSRLAEVRADALASGDCAALLLIDLDNFKTINDSLGHQVGDRLLQAIADRLLAGVPPGATPARLGGDEFVLLLEPLRGSPADAQTQAQQIASNLIARLSGPVMVDHRVLAVGASVGVAVFPDGEDGVADLLRRADIALYRAKAAGRNTVRLFKPHMQQEADTRLTLERGLRAALEQGEMDTQFALHFQPQLSPQGDLLGAEVLLRWRHPQLGPAAGTVHPDRRGERPDPCAGQLGGRYGLRLYPGMGRRRLAFPRAPRDQPECPAACGAEPCQAARCAGTRSRRRRIAADAGTDRRRIAAGFGHRTGDPAATGRRRLPPGAGRFRRRLFGAGPPAAAAAAHAQDRPCLRRRSGLRIHPAAGGLHRRHGPPARHRRDG